MEVLKKGGKMTVFLLDSEWRQKLQAELIFEKDKDMSLNMQLAQYKLIAEVLSSKMIFLFNGIFIVLTIL